MLDFIQEEETLWEKLKLVTKPIVLYGMGNGADRILDKCLAEKIPVVGVFASDAFVRGQTFRSYPVKTYAAAVEEWGDFVILLCFASESPLMLEHFRKLDEQHEVYAPHVALFEGDEVVDFAWLSKYEAPLQTVYERLADVRSREVFAAIINYKLSGKLQYLWESVSARRQDLGAIFTWGKDESYIDLGAYDGDTVREFLQLTSDSYRRIIAVEPDAKNCKKLEKFLQEEQLPRTKLVAKGIWSAPGSYNFYQRGGRMSSLALEGTKTVPVTSVDALVAAETVPQATYIKMDVEGAEYEALLGAAKCLERDCPKLFVAAYHHDNDIWQLPLLIWGLQPHYELFLRRHPYIPCWEINILGRER